MNPILLASLITTLGPLIVAGIKRLVNTDSIANDKLRWTVHSALPVALGVAAGALDCYVNGGGDLTGCILAGIAGGNGAAYVRDLDKNVLGIADALGKLAQRKAPEAR